VRLRQWLVLLLRTLAIAAIVLAFARPTYRPGPGWWRGASVPVNAVVLVDQSLSTQQRRDGGTAFAQLQRRAIELAGLFTARDRLTVLPFAQRPGEALGAGDRDQFEARLAALEPTPGTTDVGAAVAAAADILRQLPAGDSELFVLSDLAQFGWPEADAAPFDLPAARVHVVTADGAPPANVNVAQVEIPSWMPAVGRSLTVAATLHNSSRQPVDGVEVDLFLDGERVAHESVALPPGADRRVDLKVTPRRAGSLAGFVEIGDDALPADNRRYFVLDAPERIDVLVLGETPKATYYVRRALEAAAESDPALRVSAALTDNLEGLNPGTAPVVVLCNLNWMDRGRTTAIRQFVARGGALVLIPGPTADLDYYNRELLPGLLAAQLKAVGGPQGAGFQRLDPGRPHHPLFAGLLLDGGQEDIRFRASFELVPGPGLEVLASFDDGRVALAEGRCERGRAMLWAAPLDLDWTALPVRGLSVPLWHRMVRELAMPAARHQHPVVGQKVLRPVGDLPVPSQVEAEAPSGLRLRLEAQLEDGQRFWQIPRADEPGIWRLVAAGTPFDLFAVNLDPRESALQTVPLEHLQGLFGAERLHLLSPAADLGRQVLERRYGRELWRALLALAVLLLVAEQWLARAPRPDPSSAG
jgi:hypothetical protein